MLVAYIIKIILTTYSSPPTWPNPASPQQADTHTDSGKKFKLLFTII